eukprot:CAMPEP_0118939270 /NCGR_PEP_ID=MMETSP1169-20130426/28434_1 /TAXON_ID=36882 /ORGANISM="Pyramimonas obovata, Strain CCMP722" /LENGTH=407 /DNA_ID=CAMNT_0006883493 /DNA_START=18 /DNA_END=1241 /DNA_ORIENTATION=+
MSIERGSSTRGLVEVGGKGNWGGKVEDSGPVTPPNTQHRRAVPQANLPSLEHFRFQPSAGRNASSRRTLGHSSKAGAETSGTCRRRGHTHVQVIGSNQPRDEAASFKRPKTEHVEEGTTAVSRAAARAPANVKRGHTLVEIEEDKLPFIAASPGKWREKYASICPDCFEARAHCLHHPERRLQLLFIGHNPSQHAWNSGNFYSNPTNRMWKMLRLGGIIPEAWTVDDNNRIPGELGVGFTDVGPEPGNDANKYPRKVMQAWRADLYTRLHAHMERVVAWRRALMAQQQCDQTASLELEDAAPLVVAFTGKRQFAQLFDPPLKSVTAGKQPEDSLPRRWPFPATTEVWVLPSTSGRAVLKKGELEGLYIALGQRVRQLDEQWHNNEGGAARSLGAESPSVEEGADIID